MHWQEIKRRVEKEAERLLRKPFYFGGKVINLRRNGWYFEWDNAKRFAGRCHYRTKRITLSKNLARARSLDRSIDTVRHEIAHAIAGHKAGHGRIWKDACRLTGADPKRCYETSEIDQSKITYKYTATCEDCGQTYNFSRMGKHWKNSLRKSRGHFVNSWKICGSCRGTDFSFVQNY